MGRRDLGALHHVGDVTMREDAQRAPAPGHHPGPSQLAPALLAPPRGSVPPRTLSGPRNPRQPFMASHLGAPQAPDCHAATCGRKAAVACGQPVAAHMPCPEAERSAGDPHAFGRCNTWLPFLPQASGQPAGQAGAAADATGRSLSPGKQLRNPASGQLLWDGSSRKRSVVHLSYYSRRFRRHPLSRKCSCRTGDGWRTES